VLVRLKVAAKEKYDIVPWRQPCGIINLKGDTMAVKRKSNRKTSTRSAKPTTGKTRVATAKRKTSTPKKRVAPLKSVSHADISGRVRWDDTLEVVDNVDVGLMVSDDSSNFTKKRKACCCTSNNQGQFVLKSKDVKTVTGEGRSDIVVTKGDTILHRSPSMLTAEHNAGRGYDILLPAALRNVDTLKVPMRHVGDIDISAVTLAELKPEDVLEVAQALVDPKAERRLRTKIGKISKDLLPVRQSKRWVCEVNVIRTLEAIVELKKWPREVGLELENILNMGWTGFATHTHDCPNFSISYQDSGTAAVPSSTAAEDVIDPGSNPPVVIGTLPAGGVPTYIKRICFWLERALAAYVNAPFSMKNPAASGKIPVVVNSAPYGSASATGTFYLNNNLADDLMCAVAVHELFHMVQYEYGGSGTWRQSVFEGGAVFAEDSAADLMNRYLDETRTNFNGTGVLANPNISLDTASYKASLFWKYVAEQHSSDITEPFVGVETYRKIIETLSAGSYSTSDLRSAIRDLPWYQDFYEFHYLDAAKLDRTNSETTFGNYVLACYLKDLGINKPDRRFDFMEDEENIHIDNVIGGTTDITSMPSVTVTNSVSLTASGVSSSQTFIGNVNNLANRYYVVNVDTAVTNIEIVFSAGSGFNSHLFQIVQIDEDGNVRDIHRTDSSSYTKRIANAQGGKKLDRLLIVVSGCENSGSYNIDVDAVSPAPDVMITRWHSLMKKEYEIDSRNWAWTWVSPDIWVDNDGNGVADSEVYFNYNNKLNVRLHNKGNANASNIQVQLFYQSAAGGLSDAAWLPVRNKAGSIQTLTGLTLNSGTSNNWSVDWSPVPDGSSHHFCVRAIVTVPGDPNTDNKRVLSNFGNVKTKFPFFDITLIRRNNLQIDWPIRLRLIPRLPNNYRISSYDFKRQELVHMKAGEISVDKVRIYRSEKSQIHPHFDEYLDRLNVAGVIDCCGKQGPDLQGEYSTPAESLPPGVAGRPMVTVVHEADGLALGGVTFLLSEE
jgi:hypothetical protein